MNSSAHWRTPHSGLIFTHRSRPLAYLHHGAFISHLCTWICTEFFRSWAFQHQAARFHNYLRHCMWLRVANARRPMQTSSNRESMLELDSHLRYEMANKKRIGVPVSGSPRASTIHYCKPHPGLLLLPLVGRAGAEMYTPPRPRYYD